MTPPVLPDETLDPRDWDRLRVLAHRMVDDALNYLRDARERPVWQPMPESAKAALRVPLPREPQDPEQIYREYLDLVQPYTMGTTHPRFWGWVIGSGTPLGVLADMLASTLNPNCGGADHSGSYVELQVIDWCRQLVGFPAEASGLLVSGGSMANLVGLTVGRNARAGWDVRARGVAAGPPLAVYASSEAHSSVPKAVELLGLGREALRLVPVDGEYRMNLAALREMLAADRAAGRRPFCVVGAAGTVNTGASDDLEALADLCREEELWFHVDGAFGALAMLVEEQRPVLKGMERADSLAFDLHKWMYMPYEIGCTLVRDPALHRASFAVTPAYLARATRGLAGGPPWFSDFGVQLSRNFRALKAWMSLKEHGADRYARLIRQNIAQAAYLARLVQEAPDLELLAPAPLNIVCLRYRGAPALPDDRLDEINREILMRLHEDGIAVPSTVTLGGRFGIRVAITNHRSRWEDFELLVREVRRLGVEIG